MNNNSQVSSSIKWSFISEVVVKIISPITNMILARLLTPDSFGIVATLVMITSFVDMFTDAGFQKYIIQHQFSSESQQSKYISVAFFSNLFISLILYFIIFAFSSSIAYLTGIEGYGHVIRIYSIIIIFTSFSSIQFAIYRKEFKYKKLGIIRIITKFIPFFVTIPITLFTHSFWALVIGNIVGELVTSIILMIWSDKKIKVYYNFNYLKKMFSFCSGSMLETFSSWMVSNISIFIIGQSLGIFYLGLYKASITTVNQIISIITASTMNVLFSSLSLQQNNDKLFKGTISSFQKNMGLFTIPLGVGLLIFRKTVTVVLLGNQWLDASFFIGLWGLVMCESVIYADIGAYTILSKGKPFYVFISNAIQALLILFVLLLVRNYGFTVICVSCFIIRWQLTITHYSFASKIASLKITNLPKELLYYYIAAFVMAILGFLLNSTFSFNIVVSIFEIVLCGFVYFLILTIFPTTRKQLSDFLIKIIYKMNERKKKI